MIIQFWSKLHGTKPDQWIGVPIKVGSKDIGYVTKVLAESKSGRAFFEAKVDDEFVAATSKGIYVRGQEPGSAC